MNELTATFTEHFGSSNEAVTKNLTSPEIRPAYIDTAQTVVKAINNAAIRVLQALLAVQNEPVEIGLVVELHLLTRRNEDDIKNSWSDDTLIGQVIFDVLVGLKSGTIKPRDSGHAVLTLLSKSPKFHRLLKEKQELAEARQPYAKNHPLD